MNNKSRSFHETVGVIKLEFLIFLKINKIVLIIIGNAVWIFILNWQFKN